MPALLVMLMLANATVLVNIEKGKPLMAALEKTLADRSGDLNLND